MSENSRIDELLDRYQEQLDEGKTPSLDELCSTAPELRTELERHIARLLRVSNLLGDATTDPLRQNAGSLSDDKTWVNPASGLSAVLELPAPAGYEIIAPLGEGGMGIVYKARQVGLNRLVALKMVLAGTRARAIDLARFRDEAQAIAALRHPNIVQVYEIGEFRNQPFFSLEFCRGATLTKALNGEPQAPMVAAAMTEVLARAIHYAHSRGIVHRDLKPSNVLLSTEGGPADTESSTIADAIDQSNLVGTALVNPASMLKITDFGLAKRVDDDSGRTQDGSVIGTPSYMAPEQAFGNVKDVAAATDVHALGAMLYEFLTGRPPFKGSSVNETLEMVRFRDPVPVRQLQPRVPADLETICLKCLQKDPGKRYESAEALADDLDRFRHGRAVRARRTSRVERAWRWCRREPKSALLVGAVGLFAVVLSALVAWYGARLGTAEQLVDEHRKGMLAALREEKTAREAQQIQKYMADVTEARRLRIEGRLGWTWESRRKLQSAANNRVAIRDPVALRSELAAALATLDVRPIAEYGQGLAVGTIATGPEGQIAIAPQVIAPLVQYRFVLVVDPQRKTELRLPFSVGISPKSFVDSSRVLAFSPDGRWLFLGLRSGFIFRWDLHANPEVTRKEWQAHANTTVTGLVCSADSKWLFSCGNDGRVKRWPIDATDQLPAAVWPADKSAADKQADLALWNCGESGVLALSSSGGQWLDEESLLPMQPARLQRLAWTQPRVRGSSGRMVVHAQSGTIAIAHGSALELNFWERGICQSLGWMRDPDLDDADAAHTGTIESLAIHPTGTWIASACPHEGMVKIWHTPTRGLALTIPVADARGVAFCPDGNHLAIGGDHVTRLYEINGPRWQSHLAHRGLPIRALAVSPLGKIGTLAVQRPSGPAIQHGTIAAVWDSNGRILNMLVHQMNNNPHVESERIVAARESERFVFLTGNGQRFSCTTDGTIEDMTNVGRIQDLAVDSCGRYWQIENETRLVVRSANGNELLQTVPLIFGLAGRKGMTCIRDAGTSMLIGCTDGYLRSAPLDGAAGIDCACFDVSTTTAFTEQANSVHAVDVAPDGRLAVAGTQDGRVWFFRLPRGEKLGGHSAHSDRVNSIAFDRSGRWLATGSRDRTVRLWRKNGEQFETYVTLQIAGAGAVRDIRFSPRGDFLLVLRDKESAIRVWPLADLQHAFAGLGIESP